MKPLLADPPLATPWAARWEQRFGPWGAALVVGVLTQVLSFVVYSYDFSNRLDFTLGRIVRSYGPMCEDPWRTDLIGEPQVRHRLLAPVLAWLLGLRGPIGVVVPIAAIAILGAVIYRLLRDRDVPANLAVVTTLLLGTTPVIFTSQVWLGCTDSLGHLGIALCLYCRRIWPLALIMFVGMMGEERALGAVPLILLWHFTQEEPGWTRWRNGLLRTAHFVAAAALWFGVFSLVKTHYIEPYIASAPPDIQEQYAWTTKVFRGVVLREQLLTIPSGIFYAFRAGYLLPILLVIFWLPRRGWEAALLVVGFLLGLVQAVLIHDVTRATAYQYPFLLLAVVQLHRMGTAWVAYATVGACMLNYLTPVYMTTSRWHNWIAPLPLNLVKYFLGLGPAPTG